MLRTPRLILREWREEDREPFAALNADPDVMRYFPAVLSREQSDDTVNRIQAIFRKHGFGFYAAELIESGAFIGFIGMSVPSFEAPFMPCVEIGWRLAREYWNRGLATEGAAAVVEHAFGACGLAEVVAFTTRTNLPSRRVMEKLGMTYDPRDDFEHPGLEAGHPLRPHVLYRLSRADRAARG